MAQAAKFLSAEQCEWLHQKYPPPNCCICNARAEMENQKNHIDQLREEIWELKDRIDDMRYEAMEQAEYNDRP